MNIECLPAYQSQISKNSGLLSGSCTSPIVFIVNSDLAVRQSLQSAIIGAGWDIHSFDSTDEFLAYPRFAGPSCLILDITSTEPSGHLQNGLAAGRGHMPILLVTRSGNLLLITHTVQTGVVDFPTTPFERDRIVHMVRGAISASEAALRREQEMEMIRVREAALTGRERQVMKLVATGLLNKQIGHKLGISEITVKAHRGNVMRKMKARSAAELVRMVAILTAGTGGNGAGAS